MVKIQTLIKNRLGQLFKQLASSNAPVIGYLIGLNHPQHGELIINFMKSLSNFDQDELDLMEKVIIPNGLNMVGIYTTANSVGKLLGEGACNDIASHLPLLISKQFTKLMGRELLVMVGGATSIDLYRVKDNNCTVESFEEFSELQIIGDRNDMSNLNDQSLACLIARVHCDLTIVYQVDSSKKSDSTSVDSIVESFKNQTERFVKTLTKPENIILKTVSEQTEIATSRKNKNSSQSNQSLVASVEIHDSADTLSQTVETILPEKLSLIDQSTQHLKVDANFNKKETTKNKKKKLPKQTLGEFLKTTEKLNDTSQTMSTISKILHLNCFINMAANQYSTEQGMVLFTDKKLANCTISLESSSYIPVNKKSLSLERVREIIIEGLIKQLGYISNNIGKGFLAASVGANKYIKNIGFYQFLPKDYPHIFTCCYPFYSDDLVFEQRNEQYCIKLREEYHKRLYFSLKQPFIRTNQALAFGRSSKSKVSDFNKKILNVHNYVGYPSTIKSTGANNLHLVRGDYLYSHYCQDKFSDEGWGCAYRSLQTLISHAQYHSGSMVVNLPTHDEIQKCLVDCGDKQKSFLGSSQWIGAFENTIVLEKWCGVQCKVLYVNRGDEMNSHARAIANHFDANGSPIMIGGGVLAYTMLGIEFDEMTGDVSYLILDPHFTGSIGDSEYLEDVISGGWCGWKTREQVFKDSVFYNLCMPQLTSDSV